MAKNGQKLKSYSEIFSQQIGQKTCTFPELAQILKNIPTFFAEPLEKKG